MSDEARLNTRQAAYVDQIRGLYRRERTIGLVGCLVGVLLLVVARYRLPDLPWLLWAAVAMIGGAWALFAFAYFRRVAWVRAHPFDPNG